MTLILTALCKNGICVCADRRYKKTDSNGAIRLEDNHNKIYPFQEIPYVILNHGINEICGKDWKIYCREYETSNDWEGKSHLQIVNNFKEYIGEVVKRELDRYKDKEKHAIGFLLGGKPSSESKYKMSEIHWLRDKGITNPCTTSYIHTYKRDPLLITGSDDIKAYLIRHIENNLGDYSNISKFKNVKKKLVSLFDLAVKKKQRPDNEDFSDESDFEFIGE